MTINALLEYSDIDRFNVFSKRVQSTIDSQTGTINRAASLSLSPSLPVYHSASAMARGLPNISLCFCVTSFFILLSKGKTFLFKTLSLLSSLVNIFFCMILPHNYEINIIMDLNFFMCIRSDFCEPDPVVIVNLPVIENKV